MSQFLTTNTLIESIKRRANIPQNQVTFKTADFLAFINEEVKLGIVPSVLRLHENYFLRDETIALVANKSNYEIPYRAIGNKLRDIYYQDDNGNLFEMSQIDVENLAEYSSVTNTNRVYYYYIRNNEVILLPEIGDSVSGNIYMLYYIRPNEIVEESRCPSVTNIDTTTGIVTLSSIPTHFSTSISYDIISKNSPHKCRVIDITSTAISTTLKQITLDPDDLEDVVVGDYLCKAEETLIPQIPEELHSVLAHRVAMKCMEAQGDVQGMQLAGAKLGEMENNTVTLINNRVEGSPKKIVSKFNHLRYGISRRRMR